MRMVASEDTQLDWRLARLRRKDRDMKRWR
jgi:hypothetical protein